MTDKTNEKKPAIMLKICHSDDLLMVDVPCRLFAGSIPRIGLPFDEQSFDYRQQQGPTQRLMNSLNEIDGLVEAYSENAYNVRVQKAGAFRWDELIPQILPAIFRAYNEIKEAARTADEFEVIFRNLSADPLNDLEPSMYGLEI